MSEWVETHLPCPKCGTGKYTDSCIYPAGPFRRSLRSNRVFWRAYMNKLFVMNGGLVALSDDERYVRDLTEEELAEVARRCNNWADVSSVISDIYSTPTVRHEIEAQLGEEVWEVLEVAK